MAVLDAVVLVFVAVTGVVVTVLVMAVVEVVVVIFDIDAHTSNPSPNTLPSLDHTNSEPAVTFTPSGPHTSQGNLQSLPTKDIFVPLLGLRPYPEASVA